MGYRAPKMFSYLQWWHVTWLGQLTPGLKCGGPMLRQLGRGA